MNSYIKNLLNFKSYVDSSPYSILRTKIKPTRKDVSDLFPFNIDRHPVKFIAENNLSLLIAKRLNCQHIFHFFDESGNVSNVHKVSTNCFHFCVDITLDITGGVKFGSFTHHVEYSDNIMSQDDTKAAMENISFQHRGYLGFEKDGGFLSYVHGNFGGLYINSSGKIESLARLRKKYVYTPQFSLKGGFNYDLVFSNPTNKKTSIKFTLHNRDSSSAISTLTVNPFGTVSYALKMEEASPDKNISWETSLPVGRCVVFEKNKDDFDVFHS